MNDMNGIGRWYAGNASHPHGIGGRLVLSLMSMIHRPFWSWALSAVPRTSLRVLDVGGGSGGAFRLLASRLPDAAFTLLDPSSESIRMARRCGRVHVVQGSAESLPFADESFDLIILLDSVYYIDIDIAFPEICRVLSPDGVVIVGFEASDPDAVPSWASESGVVVRRPEDVRDAMVRSGLLIISSVSGRRAWTRIVGRKRLC